MSDSKLPSVDADATLGENLSAVDVMLPSTTTLVGDALVNTCENTKNNVAAVDGDDDANRSCQSLVRYRHQSPLTVRNIGELKQSVLHLSKLHEGLKSRAMLLVNSSTRPPPPSQHYLDNTLRHVHFDESTGGGGNKSSSSSPSPLRKTLNVTYTVQMDTNSTGQHVKQRTTGVESPKSKQPPLKSIGNVRKSPVKQQQQQTSHDKAKVARPTGTSAVSSDRLLASTTTAAAGTTKARVVLTYQQRRQQMLDEKARHDKQLETLRHKVVERKFAYLWLRKHTYSDNRGLLPSQAIAYYQRRLLVAHLTRWRLEVRFERNEWRATVKADCHFKYIIMNKVWDEWKRYVQISKQEKEAQLIADTFYCRKLTSKCLGVWLRMRVEAKRKRAGLNKIRELRNAEIVKEHYAMWRWRFSRAVWKKRTETVAVDQFRFVQLSKCFAKWHFKLSSEQEERRKWRLARHHHDHTVLAKCLHALRIYRAYRRKKRVQKNKLKEYAESQLVYRVYQTWLAKWEARRVMHDQLAQAEQFEQRYVALRCLDAWRAAYASRCESREREAQMSRVYERRLKRRAFDALRCHFLEAKSKRLDVHRAERFERDWTRRICLSRWQDKLEQRMEMKSMHLVYKARQFRAAWLKREALAAWLRFVVAQRVEHVKADKADEFYAQRLLARSFDALVRYAETSRTRRANDAIAVDYHTKQVWYKVFAHWTSKYELAVETQMNSRMAILHNECKVKLNTLCKWRDKLQSLIKSQLNEKLAGAFYAQTLLKRSFRVWLEQEREAKVAERNAKLAAKHDFERLCRPAFTDLKTHAEVCRMESKRCEQADTYHKLKCVQRLFAAWRQQTVEFKRINRLVELKHRHKEQETCRRLLSTWSSQVQAIRSDKQHSQLADIFHLRQLSVRIITEWHTWASHRTLKHYNDQAQCDAFARIRLRLARAKYYNQWQRRTRELQLEALAWRRATRFHEVHTTRVAWCMWRERVGECRQERALCARAALFLEMRLKTEYYFKWTLRYERESQMRDKNEQALMFWSLSIQRTCLRAWLDWLLGRKQKRHRYALVLQQRQHHVLKECARSFVRYAVDARARRLQITRHLKQAYEIDKSELAYKYFHIWLAKCNARRRQQQQQPYLKRRLHHQQQQQQQQINDVTAVTSGVTLEAREQHRDADFAPVKSACVDTLTRAVRAAPRKPAFLLDSISVDLAPQQTNATNIQLLPPSAFATPKPPVLVTVDTPEQPAGGQRDSSNSGSHSAASIWQSKRGRKDVTVHFDDFDRPPITKMNSVPNLHLATSSVEMAAVAAAGRLLTPALSDRASRKEHQPPQQQQQQQRRSAPSQAPPKKKAADNNSNQLELIELKKRLESLALTSEKLKRLKEQEKLLANCIQSGEINQTSMCGTIYDEREQVQTEINELTKRLREEKLLVNELVKKHNIQQI